MKRRIPIVLLLLSCAAITSFAQDNKYYEDHSIYYNAANGQSMLFRGRLAPEYRFLYNGTYYVGPEGFKKGEIKYNGRVYRDVELNLDSYEQMIVVRHGLISATDRRFVEYAIIGGDKYVPIPTGYGKVGFEGRDCRFYSQVSKSIVKNEGSHNGADIGYDDPDYKNYVELGGRYAKVMTYFAYSVRYYLEKDGKFVQIKSKPGFYKCFDKETAKEMKKIAKAQGFTSLKLDRFVVAMLNYMEGQE